MTRCGGPRKHVADGECMDQIVVGAVDDRGAADIDVRAWVRPYGPGNLPDPGLIVDAIAAGYAPPKSGILNFRR